MEIKKRQHSPEVLAAYTARCLVMAKNNIGRKHGPMSAETREKIRISKLGNKNRLGKYHSLETRLKISKTKTGTKLSEEHKRKISESEKGSKHYNWQGGKTSAHEAIRNSFAYRCWKRSVYKRDKYTCVLCGANRCEVHADHIKPFAYFPELRFNVENGRTLCKQCHRATPTYGSNIIKNKHMFV